MEEAMRFDYWQLRPGWLVAAGLGLVLTVASPVQGQWFRSNRCCSPVICCPPETCCPPSCITPKPAESVPTKSGVPPVEPAEPEKKPGEPPPLQPPATPGMDAADTPYSADLGGGQLSSFDSAVGYIDNAIPSNMVRLRVDAAWNNNRATRAEFFYARGAPLGPGLPLPERSIDYQEIMNYLEGRLTPNLSLFFEYGARLLNPDINRNHAGFGDINTGFKWAFVNDPDRVASIQFKVFAPTGDSGLGLGTEHVSLQPGLLLYQQLSDRLRMESELQLWIPVGGTSFAGEVLRYGVGFSFGRRPQCGWWANPVLEVVGWTVLSGQELDTFTPPLITESAAGDTIVNAKVGIRIGLGSRFSFYSGYGRALTGEVWYKDLWRNELRWNF
jgi:hypothetical protein